MNTSDSSSTDPAALAAVAREQPNNTTFTKADAIAPAVLTALSEHIRPGPLPTAKPKASAFKQLTQTEDGFLVDTYGRAYKRMRDGSVRKVPQ